MPTLQIAGVAVEFPKDPYPCQSSFMERAITAMTRSENASRRRTRMAISSDPPSLLLLPAMMSSFSF
jgi:hypothetical protein